MMSELSWLREKVDRMMDLNEREQKLLGELDGVMRFVEKTYGEEMFGEHLLKNPKEGRQYGSHNQNHRW